MDLSIISTRLATASGLLHEFVVFETPGIIFLITSSLGEESLVKKLLATEYLGYSTKITLLVFLGFVIGIALTSLGDSTQRLIGRGWTHFLQKAFKKKDLYKPSEVEIGFLKKVFSKIEETAGRLDPDVFRASHDEPLGLVVLNICLLHYTSKYNDLKEQMNRKARVKLILASVAIGLILGVPWATRPYMFYFAGVGVLMMLLSVKEGIKANSLGIRVVLSGYLRDQQQ